MGSIEGLAVVLAVSFALLNVASSTVTVDTEASSAFKELQSGSKKYVVFKLSPDYSTLLLERSSSGDFPSLASVLSQAKEEGQPLYAIYSAKIRETGDTRLIFYAWIPQSASVAAKKVYKDEADDVIEALAADIWVQVFSGSPNDLNLDIVVESGLAGYNVIESSDYVYDLQDAISAKEKATVDSGAVSAFSKAVQGGSPYVTFDVSNDFTSITFDKAGARGAGFDQLKADLESATNAKFALYQADVQIGDKRAKNWFLINWIPPHLSDADRVKIRNLVPQLKAALKTDFFFEFPTSSVDDLDLKKILNLALGGKVQTPSGHVRFTLDPGAIKAVSDLVKGSIRYALFKFSNDLSSIVVDKIAPIGAAFNNFLEDLIDVQNQKDVRYCLFRADITVSGKPLSKVLAVLWAPFNAPEKHRSLYETNFPSFKVLSKAPILLDVKATSVGDLNLDAIFKVAIGKEYQGQGNLGGNVFGEADANIPDVKFDLNGVNAVKQLMSGLKRYVIFSLSPTGQVTVDKVAEKSASFANLKAELSIAMRKGQSKYAIFLVPVPVRGQTELKPVLITSAPLNGDKKLRLLYLKSVPKFKAALGINFWSEFTAITPNDLQLPGLVKTGLKNNLLKLSLGGLSMNLGSDLLNPIGVLGSLVGTTGDVVGGLAGSVLSLGQGLLGGVLGLGSGIINGLFGGVLGGQGGLLGGFLGSGQQGGLLGGVLGGKTQEGVLGGGQQGGLLGGFLGGGQQGGGLLGGLLGGVTGAVDGVVKTGANLLNQEFSGITGDTSGGLLGGILGGSSNTGTKKSGFLFA